MSQQRHSTRARNVSVHVRLGQNALGPFVTACVDSESGHYRQRYMHSNCLNREIAVYEVIIYHGREYDVSTPLAFTSIEEEKKNRRLEAEKFFERALTHPHIVFFFSTPLITMNLASTPWYPIIPPDRSLPRVLEPLNDIVLYVRIN